MPLCKGTLEQYLAFLKQREITMTPLEVTEIMIHILTGLYHCHVQGYCHRDLKLSNGIDGLVMTADFECCTLNKLANAIRFRDIIESAG
jgi:serine/threonine protein kinase